MSYEKISNSYQSRNREQSIALGREWFNSVLESKKKKSWSEYNRMKGFPSFWAVVNYQGHWIDSAMSYEVALSLAAEAVTGKQCLTTQEAVDYFASTTHKPVVEVSVIHSSMLERIYEHGNFLIDND